LVFFFGALGSEEITGFSFDQIGARRIRRENSTEKEYPPPHLNLLPPGEKRVFMKMMMNGVREIPCQN
jgi:hypothetical protein